MTDPEEGCQLDMNELGYPVTYVMPTIYLFALFMNQMMFRETFKCVEKTTIPRLAEICFNYL